MALRFKSWDYTIPATRFDSVSELVGFVSDCKPLMDRVTFNHDHDRFTDFVHFYREYKKQNLSLVEYTNGYKLEKYPDESRPDCIGRALKLKAILEEEYPHLREKLYVASTTIDFQEFNRKLTKEMEDNCYYVVNFNDHCILTLKFEVEGRKGFVLYEMSFLNNKPVIVMTDNQSPHYATISLPKGRRAAYECKNENYVEVSFKPEEKAERSVTGVDVFTITVFVGGSFQRPDISAIFCLFNNMQYGYSLREGNLIANFSHYGAVQIYNFQLWNSTTNGYDKFKIPVEYFLRDEKEPEIEMAFKKLAKLMQYDEQFLRESLAVIATSQFDKDFIKHLGQLRIVMNEARQKYVQTSKIIA